MEEDFKFKNNPWSSAWSEVDYYKLTNLQEQYYI